MFTITELPRVDGVVTGDFVARHKSPSFSLEGHGFQFANGVTVSPLRARVADRLQAAFGADVVFEACDRASGEAAIAWMVKNGHAAQRIEEAKARVAAAFGDKLEGKIKEFFQRIQAKVVADHPPVPEPSGKKPEIKTLRAGDVLTLGGQSVVIAEAPPPETWPVEEAPAATPSTPVNQAELDALSEADLRVIAEQMGATDKRWKIPRLRRFIADELGIDIEEEP